MVIVLMVIMVMLIHAYRELLCEVGCSLFAANCIMITTGEPTQNSAYLPPFLGLVLPPAAGACPLPLHSSWLALCHCMLAPLIARLVAH